MAKIATPEQKNGTKRAASLTASREDEQAQIAKLAYQYFVERGYQHGYDAEDWLRAEAAVRGKKK